MFILTYYGNNLDTLRAHVYTHVFSNEKIDELKQLVEKYKKEIGYLFHEDDELSEVGLIEEGNYIYSFNGDTAEYTISVQYVEDGYSHKTDFSF